MAKYNFYIKDSQGWNPDPHKKKEPQQKTNEITPIRLHINYKTSRLKLYTGYSTHPKQWDFKKQQYKSIKSVPNAIRMNERLGNVKIKAEAAYLDYLRDNNNSIPPPSALKEKIYIYINLRQEEKRDLFSFFESYIEQQKVQAGDKPIRETSIPSYQSCLNSLKKYQNNKNRRVDFDSIDMQFYTDYVQFLDKDLGLKLNTQGKYIRRLKTILSKATAAGINKNLMYKDSSFKAFSEEVDNIYLSEIELDKLQALDLDNSEEIIRDLFIVLAFTGIRHSDLKQVTTENIEGANLYIKQQKTDHRITIPLLAPAVEILKKYDYILPAFTLQYMNRVLKSIGQKLNEKDKTRSKDYSLAGTHTGRRSFASNMYRRGIPMKTIMGVTGHRTQRDFLKYLKMSSDEDAESIRRSFENNRPKE